MSILFQDIRLACRALARERTFAAVSVSTLALCVAANTAMFGVVRSVLFEPLPFPDSKRVVLLYNSYPNAGAARAGASVPDYFDRLAAVPALGHQGLYRLEGMTYGDENGVERLASIRVTPSFFRVVGVQPVRGRLFRDDEGERGRALKVILSHAFWHRKFGGSVDVVGRTIRLNGNPFDVVGIMPREFTFLQSNIDVFVPTALLPADRGDDRRHSNNWQMIGRLARGATIEQAIGQIDALNASNDRRFPEFHKVLDAAGFHTVVVRLQDDVVRDVTAVLYLLWGGVLFVLLIGCLNVANLVTVRATVKRRDMATRYAIGGAFSRLARQILTETMLLAVSGGTLGILLGWWILKSIAAIDLDRLPRGYEVDLDLRTVAVAWCSVIAIGLALAAAPAFAVRRMNLSSELHRDDRGGTGDRRANTVRRALATLQVAAAFVLLVGAGLLLASFRAVLRLDLGFQPDRVVTATVNLPATAYRDEAALLAFSRRALDAIRARAEIESAGLVTAVPFSGAATSNVILAEGHVLKPGESLLAPSQLAASPGYFETMRIPVVRGRAFDERDAREGAATVIVDERLARRFWPDGDPIGRRLYFPSDSSAVTRITPETQFFTVVGIVKDVHSADPRPDSTPVGTFYLSHEQVAPRGVTFVVRTRVPSSSVLGVIRKQIAEIDPQVPIFRGRSMHEWIERALVARRLSMLVATAFGALALLLAGIGVYGVIACRVSQRRREFGVRMALGSTAGGIFRLVLRDGATIVAGGLAIGLTASMFVGRLMRAQLFGVGSTDPRIMVSVSVLLSFIALAAVVIPSRRAAKVDPVSALNT